MSNEKKDLSNLDKIKGFVIDYKLPIALIAIIAIAGISIAFIFFDIKRSENRLLLATTTSTNDSGLLDYLIPEFEEESGVEVDVLSVGTGQALEIGSRGDADMLLVHARDREDEFVSSGYGIHRVCVMFNDFILVGPSSDPAGIKNADNITNVMNKLYSTGEGGSCEFYSRGDDSGTHTKEKFLWNASGLNQENFGNWYKETGDGMGGTLTVTNDQGGYTLADRGTWLFMKDNLENLQLGYNSSEVELLNPYGAIPLNPNTFSDVKYEYALEFTSFLVSEKGQNLIGNYTVNNQKLFTPCFGKCNETHECSTTQDEIDFWTQLNGGYIRPSNIFLGITSNL